MNALTVIIVILIVFLIPVIVSILFVVAVGKFVAPKTVIIIMWRRQKIFV